MTRPRKADEMLALVRAEAGLTTQQIADRVGVSLKHANNQLAILGQRDLVVSVRSKNAAVWATPEDAEPMRAAIRAAGKQRKTAAEKASRQRAIENEDVDCMPVVRVWSSTWAPVHQAPGPISVFHLGCR